jgi:hypothetical protein
MIVRQRDIVTYGYRYRHIQIKFTLEQATKFHRESRCIALLLL